MPRSKRAKVVHLSKTTKKGKELTLKLHAAIQDSIPQYEYLYVFRVDNMRNAYLKDVRTQLADSRCVPFAPEAQHRGSQSQSLLWQNQGHGQSFGLISLDRAISGYLSALHISARRCRPSLLPTLPIRDPSFLQRLPAFRFRPLWHRCHEDLHNSCRASFLPWRRYTFRGGCSGATFSGTDSEKVGHAHKACQGQCDPGERFSGLSEKRNIGQWAD